MKLGSLFGSKKPVAITASDASSSPACAPAASADGSVQLVATAPAMAAHEPPTPAKAFGVWRGRLETGRALDELRNPSAEYTRKYRDELAYWVSLQHGESQRLFGGPFWDIFRGWQIDRMRELAAALGVRQEGGGLDGLKAWSATRSAVEIGPGPFPSIAILPWRRAVAIDPLADGYVQEGIVPPDADHVVFIGAPAEATPLPAAFADILVAENCLDHVDDPEAVLAEVSRLLRPDGLFWLLVDLMDYRDHMHPNPFSEASIKRMLAAAGFTAVTERVSDHKSHPNAYGEYRGLLRKTA